MGMKDSEIRALYADGWREALQCAREGVPFKPLLIDPYGSGENVRRQGQENTWWFELLEADCVEREGVREVLALAGGDIEVAATLIARLLWTGDSDRRMLWDEFG